MTQSAPIPLDAGASPLAGKTILQIVTDLDHADAATLDVAAALAAAGARPLVAGEGGGQVSDLQARGGVWIPFPAASRNPVAMAANTPKLARLIREERVDIVHARTRAAGWVAYAATRLTKTPFVTTYLGAYSGRSSVKVSYNSVMARGDVVIANSDYTASLIARLHPFAQDRVRVIHRGADFRTFTAGAVAPERVQALRAAWGVEPDDRIVLLPGRLGGAKGHLVLIEAAKRLVERGVADARFILAGDSGGRGGAREIDDAIARKKLEGVARRVGACEDMPAAYLASAIVVAPSTEPESFGRIAVEAQAMGTPVIVSDVGALPETVLAAPRVAPNERTGWTVASGDAEALADAIGEALALGASARDAMAIRARVHVLRRFSQEQMIAETLDAYVALLQRR